MKLNILLLMLFVSMTSILVGEELKKIEDQILPTNTNAGRTIMLKEIMRIAGGSESFYLKRPSNIKIAPDGSIFFTDVNQFLRFNNEGAFLNNQQNRGEGPGEYNYIMDYFFSENKIVLFTAQPSKIIETDLNGKLLNEYRIESRIGFNRIIGLYDKRYYCVVSDYTAIEKKNSGEIDVDLELAWGTAGGTINKTGILLPEKWYLLKKSIGKDVRVNMSILVPVLFAPDQSGNLFICHTQRYLITKVNLAKEKVIAKFSRKYSSVRYQEEESDKKGTRQEIPNPRYYTDIQKMVIYKDYLLVFTSTLSPGKGVLVDVLTKDGKYVDYFFLPMPQVENLNYFKIKPLALYDGFLYTVEKDEEENPVLVKYMLNLQL